jgi:hypothetical protein
MRFNSKFEQLYNMIMESFRDPNDPYEDDEHEKIISGIKRNAKNPAILNNIRKEFKDSIKYVDLNDPIHVERLKKIVQDEISAFNFPPGKRIFPTYAYQKTIYELEKKYGRYGAFSFKFDDFKKKLIDVINNKVYNDRK